MKIGSIVNSKGLIHRYADMNGIYDNVYELVRIDKGHMSTLVPKDPNELVNVSFTEHYCQDPNDDATYLVRYYSPMISTRKSSLSTIVSYYYRFVKTVNHPVELPQ